MNVREYPPRFPQSLELSQYFEPLAGGGRHFDWASGDVAVAGNAVDTVVLNGLFGGGQDTLVITGVAWQSTDFTTTRPFFNIGGRPILIGNPTNNGRIQHNLSASLAELYPLRGALWTGGPFQLSIVCTNTGPGAQTVRGRIAGYIAAHGVRPTVSDPYHV